MGSQTPFNPNKAIIDEVSGWLRVSADGTVDRTWTGPPEALFLLEPVPPYTSPRDGITVHDITAVDPTLRLRIYFPEDHLMNQETKLPILVHFHGGGFCISHATWLMYHQFYTRLARAVPAIVVSPFLPLAPEHRLPAALDASYSALLSLRSFATTSTSVNNCCPSISKLQNTADFSRVFLIGDSSGGNLVHHVAARAGAEEEGFWSPMKLAGGIPIHPGFMRATRSRSELEQKPDPFLTLDMVDKFMFYGLPEEATKDHPYACPMGDEEELQRLNLPPFMVGVAEKDLLRDTILEYCEAMKQAQKEVEVYVSKEVGHSFYLNKMAVDFDPVTGKRTEELIMAVKDFLDRH